MSDRIYATYTPTMLPGIFHTAIHYERRDPDGNLLDHTIIEAKPERYNQMGSADKAWGEFEETIRADNGPSRFGSISATVRPATGDYDPNAPYEILAEGDDLGENLARMKLFAHGVNRAGFAYRGHHQNSNNFASAALQAGNLPPPAGIASDPRGRPGELLEFFAPGLNQRLQPPIGPSLDGGSNSGISGTQGPSPEDANQGLTGIFTGRRTKPRDVQPPFFFSR